MKYLLLIIAFALSACTTVVPVTVPFPKQPEELKASCPALQEATSTQIGEFTKTVVTNYQQYHDCSDKVTAWQTWYNKQKQLYEELNK